ncbi:hypothetical protein AB0I54_21475 [Streptomyces sp. NPDC050625]|uniref:hypothetical protein n=1 Tax=Streptomyces sp. NPDC050625 TaxID=3154629 RepID=UPI0034499B0E
MLDAAARAGDCAGVYDAAGRVVAGTRRRDLDSARPLPDGAQPPNTALAHAETAYRAVVRAAAECVAHQAAAELLAAEAGRNRQRVRSLRRHWIPRLRR